jgi:CubicO group peptidase (beta-lactamase class C family)
MKFEDHAFDFLPWAQPLSDPRKKDITVRQLLNHTSGICPESTGARNGGPWERIMGHTDDERTAQLAFAPGQGHDYTTFAFYHAALVCENVTGQPYDKVATEKLFQPLGIERSWFEVLEGDAKHGSHPSHTLGLSARDLARIGYCMLHRGKWNDRQVIPQWFVDETAQPSHDRTGPTPHRQIAAESFSTGWELPALRGEAGRDIPKDARFKPGSGGQLIAFVPSLDLVISRQTGGSGSWQYEEYLRRACAAVLP